MRYTLAVLVENHFGVLTRVSGLFSRRGFNIESLAVGPTQDPSISRITVVVDGDERTVSQVKHQLGKLLDVYHVEELPDDRSVRRELCLIKVAYATEQLTRLLEVVRVFGAQVLDLGRRHLTVEVSGEESRVNALIDLLTDFGILEIVRSGPIALSRSPEPIRLPQMTVELEPIDFSDEEDPSWPASSTTKTPI